jgi:hypothetical protein
MRAIIYIVVQLLGAWAAFGLYQYFVNQKLTIIGGHYQARILVSEIVGAFIFAMAWAAATYRSMDGGVFASTAGIGFTLGMIVAAVAGIGLINPALALGTRAWVPWTSGVTGWGTYALGPVVGAIAGINVYGLFLSPDGGFRRVAAKVTGTVSAKPATKTASRPAAKKRTATRRKK